MEYKGVAGVLCWVGSGVFEDSADDGGVVYGVAVDEAGLGCVAS